MTDIETLLLTVSDEARDRGNIEKAGELLRSGGLVIIPTETVYGLAANACDPDAVARIFAAKGRPQDNPLIVHVDSLEMLYPLVEELPETARLLAECFWPGPLTIILPKSGRVPRETSGGLDTVAVRMPAHSVARAIIAAAGVPLAAPSANRSGSPSPTTFAHCVDDMLGRVDAIVNGGDCAVGVESTVITLCDGVPRLLRPGAVTPEQLRVVLGEIELDFGVTHRLNATTRVSSPGMKYKHYAPQAKVILLKGGVEAFARYLSFNARDGDAAVCFDEDLPFLKLPAISYGGKNDHDTQAAELFAVLRGLDKTGVQRAFIHSPDTDGVGLAVYNRLIRAAGFDIVELEERGED